MAGPYYCNIDDPAAWVGRTGVDKTSNALLGLSGLQYLADTVAVGNGPIYVRGTAGYVKNLKTFGSDGGNSGTFQRGEEITWTDGSGIVSEISGNYVTVVEIITLGSFGNDVTYTGTTSSATGVVNGAVTQKATGIDIDTQSGAYNSGFIKFIGCADDADYTVSGGTSRAVITGNDSTDAVAHGISGATVDFIWLENFRCTEAGTGKTGITTASGADSWVFLNCCGDSCAQDGMNISGAYCLVYRCVGYLNTRYGIAVSSQNSRVLYSCARDNTTHGLRGGANLTFIGCITHNNTYGVSNCSEGSLIMNCAVDSNTLFGISILAKTASRTDFTIANRITNTGGGAGTNVGLDLAATVSIGGWNYYEDNEDNTANDTYYYVIPTGASYVPGTTTEIPSDDADKADTNEGYADAVANHNFATGYTAADDPTLRRKAITIPWS